MRDVQFKLVKREDGPDQEVVEIRLNDATVAAFPADEKARDTDKTYRELYANEYDRFKRGEKGLSGIRTEDDDRYLNKIPTRNNEPLPSGDSDNARQRPLPSAEEPRKATVTGPTIDETVKPKRTVRRRKVSHK